MPIGGIGGPGPQVPRLFRSLAISASGLSAQRRRMDAIAENIANAETTRAGNGGAYKRQSVVLSPAALPQSPLQIVRAGELPGGIAAGEVPMADADATTEAGVEVNGVVEDSSEGQLVYDPAHPDADANGYVRYPNVRVTDELVDLMDARRAYEANASVFQAMKSMLKKATEI